MNWFWFVTYWLIANAVCIAIVQHTAWAAWQNAKSDPMSLLFFFVLSPILLPIVVLISLLDYSIEQLFRLLRRLRRK